jgi:hypothetical protein
MCLQLLNRSAVTTFGTVYVGLHILFYINNGTLLETISVNSFLIAEEDGELDRQHFVFQINRYGFMFHKVNKQLRKE